MTNNQVGFWREFSKDVCIVFVVGLLGMFLLQAGVFTVDESHYLLAAHAFASHGSFHIENSYETFQDPALLYFYTVIPERVNTLGTVSTVPPYHAILASPFLLCFGFLGLFMLNVLSFGLTCVAVRRLALRVLSPKKAWLAVLVFALASYSLEYALGIWPHALSQALFAWACWALLQGLSDSPRRGVFLGMAGLLLGIGVGIRLQNILFFPVFMMCLLFGQKSRGRDWMAYLLGFGLPLLGFSLINQYRLGTFNPFTYGAQLDPKLSLAALWSSWFENQIWLMPLVLGAIMGVIFWLIKIKPKKRTLYLLGLGVIGLTVFLPATRSIWTRWASSAGFHILDSSLGGGLLGSPGASLNYLGQVLYGGVLKKSLLQSVPWLFLGIMAPLFWKKWKSSKDDIQWLWILAMLGLLGLPLMLTRGGLGFNPRYLLELLPLFAIVSLHTFSKISKEPFYLVLGGGLGLVLALPEVLFPGQVERPTSGLWPLLASGLTILLILTGALAFWIKSQHPKRWAQKILTMGMACGLGIGFAFGIGIDLRRSLEIRGLAKQILLEAQSILPEGAVLLSWEPRKDIFSPLKLKKKMTLGGLGRFDSKLPDFIDHAVRHQRVFILQNGIPSSKWESWASSYEQHRTIRKGLIFVEWTLKEPEP